MEKRKVNMGAMDNKIMEDALTDLREQNESLRNENKELKNFLEYINNQLTSFVTRGNRL